MRRHWRPPLWFVLGGALGGTLALSLAGLIALRYLGPEIGFRNGAALLAALIGVLTLGLLWLLVRLLLRPVQALAAFAAETRRSGNPPPPAHYGTRELRAMGQSVLDMAQTLQNREATIRAFTDHVTHELKTPVTALLAASELLEDAELGAEDRALVAQIGSAARQMQAQLASLRAMAAAREPGHHGSCRLSALLPGLAARHPELRLEVQGDDLLLMLAESGLAPCLDHLLGNAAAQGARRLRLEARATARGAALIVADDGPGISEGNRPHVFEPFFTTRRESGGTGMGLAIVAALLRAHGGDITLTEAPPGWTGAAFRLRLPDQTRQRSRGPVSENPSRR